MLKCLAVSGLFLLTGCFSSFDEPCYLDLGLDANRPWNTHDLFCGIGNNLANKDWGAAVLDAAARNSYSGQHGSVVTPDGNTHYYDVQCWGDSCKTVWK